MDVTFQIGSLDLSKRLSTYAVQMEVSYARVLKTLDGVEHAVRSPDRAIVSASFSPMTDAEAEALYGALNSSAVTVKFRNPYTNTVETRTMRVVSNLNAAFALKSVDGNVRYKGGTIQLRAR